MPEEIKKAKRPSRRRAAAAASSPIPCGPGSTCGHSGCTGTCSVRYVGPTSHIRDHHILHAARGWTNVWGAAVVTGLAVVLTGAIAYSSVQAKETQNAVRNEGKAKADVARIVNRLETMDRAIQDLKVLCANLSTTSTPASLGDRGRHATSTESGDATSTR